MECYSVGELLPEKEDKSEFWKFITEKKEISANDYMEYKFREKYSHIDRKRIINQKQAILNYNKERKKEEKKEARL